MKFSTLLPICGLLGSALAVPAEHEFHKPGGSHIYQKIARDSHDFTKPGGSHQYAKLSAISSSSHQLGKRIGAGAVLLISIMAAIPTNMIGGPFTVRAMNEIFGVQKRKRSIHYDVADLTHDEARGLWINRWVEIAFQDHPLNVTADATVCTSVGYYISDPSKTLDAGSYKFVAKGQESEYDCFLLDAPVTMEVRNFTAADLAFRVRPGATWENNVLTVK